MERDGQKELVHYIFFYLGEGWGTVSAQICPRVTIPVEDAEGEMAVLLRAWCRSAHEGSGLGIEPLPTPPLSLDPSPGDEPAAVAAATAAAAAISLAGGKGIGMW